MFRSLKSKLTIPSIGIVVLVVVGIMLYSSNAASTLADDLIWERAYASSRAANAHITQLSAQTNVVAYAVAGDYTLVSAIMDWNAGNNRAQNRNIIIDRLRELSVSMAVDSFTVRDFEGRTIVRMHDLNFYYDIDGLANAINAIEHRQSTTSFTSTAAMPMSLITTVPIIHNGQVLGTMAPIFHFNTEAFVDNLSNNVFYAPVSIYRGRETVASSLMLDGRRAIGVEVSDYIADIVIDRGESYLLDHYIYGEGTISFYMPFRGAAGNVIGMMAVHFSTACADARTSSMVTTMMFLSGAGVLAAAGVMYFLISRNLKPLTALSKTVKEVSIGNTGVNINRTNLPKDEIGALTQDVCGLVDVLKNMVDDLVLMYNEYITLGNIQYKIDEDKYQNSFKEVMWLVNKLNGQMVVDIGEIVDMLGHIGDGDFGKKMDANVWVGEWVFVPDAMNVLVDRIRAVDKEVNSMIESIAEKGDTGFQIDDTQYNGGWKDIMDGLNKVAVAIDEPIKVALICLEEMKAGNFDIVDVDKKIAQKGLSPDMEQYKGIFKAILTAQDTTIKEIAVYIGDITQNMADIARGDLTSSISRNFVGDFAPIKESINSISSKLNATISEIIMAAEQVLMGARQISTSSTELASGAQEQASSVEELNATVDMVNQQTLRNAESATAASQLSNSTVTNAQQGNISMKEMLAAMSQIKESSADISKVIKAIEDIAFQTNLLALNASVEAARAGEHGKGFAVVADEVRNLAGRSTNSAAETNDLIATSISRVDSGAKIAQSTAVSLDTIVANVNEVSAIISNIAAASQEQTDAISHISQGLDQISKVTQSNSAVSEEAAAASQELSSQAEMLRQLVSYFKV